MQSVKVYILYYSLFYRDIMVSDNMKNVDDMDATVDDRYGIYISSYP